MRFDDAHLHEPVETLRAVNPDAHAVAAFALLDAQLMDAIGIGSRRLL
jgi:hypothetical protein